MSKGASVASVSTMVLVGLAAIGWLVFTGGFGAHKSDIEFYGKLDFISSLLPPNEAAQIRELSFIPFNSHYIVAVLSPILFIVMIVMSVLTMVLKNKRAPYVFIIISAPILILVGFVLVSGGTVLHIYSTAITFERHELYAAVQRITGDSEISTPVIIMFAGMLMEIIFLIGAIFASYSGAILAVAERKDSHI